MATDGKNGSKPEKQWNSIDERLEEDPEFAILWESVGEYGKESSALAEKYYLEEGAMLDGHWEEFRAIRDKHFAQFQQRLKEYREKHGAKADDD